MVGNSLQLPQLKGACGLEEAFAAEGESLRTIKSVFDALPGLELPELGADGAQSSSSSTPGNAVKVLIAGLILMGGLIKSAAQDGILDVFGTPDVVKTAIVSGSEEQRYQSAKLLADLAPMSRDALPQLIQALADPSQRVAVEVLHALGNLGTYAEVAGPAISAKLTSNQVAVRKAAAVALGRIGEKAKDAVPSLMQVLINDKAADVRVEVAKALGLISSDLEKTVPALIQALQDKQSDIREQAAWALGEVRPVSPLVRAPLRRLLADGNAKVRQASGDSIQIVERHLRATGKTKTILDLVTDLQSSDAMVQSVAIERLTYAGDEAIPFLVEQLNSPDYDRNYGASQVLRSITNPAVVTALENSVKTSRNEHVKANARKLLLEIKSKPAPKKPVVVISSPERIDTLISQLVDFAARPKAVADLVAMGDQAVPALVKALLSGNSELNIGVHDALRGIKKPATLPLLEAIKVSNGVTRSEVFRMIGEIADEKAKTPWIAYVQNEQVDGMAAVDAISALANYQSADVEVVLQKATQSKHLRSFALLALGRRAFPSPETLSLLCDVLKDPDVIIRLEAALALSRIGDKSVAPSLRESAEFESNPQVRDLIAKTLRRLGDFASH